MALREPIGAGYDPKSNTTTCASTPEVPQTQLAHATERLELSARLLVEMHQELNDFFTDVFGHNNFEDVPREEVDRAPGAMQDLTSAIQEMHRQLDIVRGDIEFLKEQNL